jgi:predicted TIM-barrel fold metal-dependent hydrolase
VSALLESWKRGQGLPEALVIDGHIHIGAWLHAATFRDAGEAAERAVRMMDAAGVDGFCAQSGGYFFEGQDYRLGNDLLLDVWRRLSDRMIPFMGLNPNDRREDLLAELARLRGAGVQGIKLLNHYQESYPGDGPNLMAVYEFAAAHRMVVFNHAWPVDVAVRIAGLFPETDFIFGHYQNRLDPALAARPNLYANIWEIAPMGWVERGIAAVGAGKFMMGSDGFLNPLAGGIGPVVFAPIGDAEKRAILGLTVARLLDKVGALPAALKRKYLALRGAAGS